MESFELHDDEIKHRFNFGVAGSEEPIKDVLWRIRVVHRHGKAMVDATDHLAPFVRPSPPTRIALHWFHGLPKSYEPGIQLITQRGTGIQAP